MKTERDFSIDIDSIFVIQSLPEVDRQTGTILYERVVVPTLKQHPGFHHELISVESASKFLGSLARIAHWCEEGNHSPIIHLECHGAKSCLTMANGDLVPWDLLRPSLVRINEYTGIRLLVVLGACHGMSLAQIVDISQVSPVWGIIGPTENISDSKIENGLAEFYSVLLSTMNGQLALEALNGQENPTSGDFPFFSARTIYLIAFKTYMIASKEKAFLRQRVERILKKAQLPKSERGRERRRIRNGLLDSEFWFNHCLRSFLLFDRYPENQDRIQVKFEDIQELPDHDGAS